MGARRSASGWWRANCPYCLSASGKPDRRQSLGIKPKISFFMCFKCGAKGRLPDALSRSMLEKGPDESPPPIKGPPDGYEPIWTDDVWTSLYLETPRAYLERRGVSRAIAKSSRIGIAVDGRYASRVIVPCLDLDGSTWLGFSARDWTDKQELRYRYPRGMQRAKFLYNQVALYTETDAPVIIVEGVFDALPYWPNAVACLGKPGELHERLMAEASRPIAVCLDGDSWEEGFILSEKLKLEGRQAGYVQLPPCTDPNTVDRAWLMEEAKKCISN